LDDKRASFIKILLASASPVAVGASSSADEAEIVLMPRYRPAGDWPYTRPTDLAASPFMIQRRSTVCHVRKSAIEVKPHPLSSTSKTQSDTNQCISRNESRVDVWPIVS